LTLALCNCGILAKAFSTRAEHEAQVMPLMGKSKAQDSAVVVVVAIFVLVVSVLEYLGQTRTK